MNRLVFGCILFLVLLLEGIGQAQPHSVPKKLILRPELDSSFSKYGYKGSIFIYESKTATYITNNLQQSKARFSPASTFKIFNSLVALETKVADGPEFLIQWDSVNRAFPVWNKDQTMKSAFQTSAVWYYQEIARRIGLKRMMYHIQKERYGNMDISGGIDQFWLESSLKISPEEQVEFLKKLEANKLRSFSAHTMNTVKEIMKSTEANKYVLRGKTGANMLDSLNILLGWYVGYVEERQ